MKYCFIINPASGKPETKVDLEYKIRAAASEKELDVTVLYTQRAGDATDLIIHFAKENEGEDIRFYACGGDGTLCEAVNGVMAIPDRERISLGIVPVGTGNDFVRSFEKKELFGDIEAQLDARETVIDLMRCNDLYSVNMINIGFDCQVVVKTDVYKKKKFIPSKLAYICGLIVTLIKKPGVDMKLTVDGEEKRDREFLLTTFAKGNFCGGGFNSNPGANLNDGNLNVLFVNNLSRIKFVLLVKHYKNGTHLCGKFNKILNDEMVKSYEMKFDTPTPISVDGEIHFIDHVKIECVKSAIKFLIPAGVTEVDGLVKQPDAVEA